MRRARRTPSYEISRDPSRTAPYTTHLSIVAAIVAAGLTVIAELVVAHIGYTAEMQAAVAVILLAIVPKVLNMIQEGVFVAHGKVAYEERFTRLVASCTYVAIAAWMLAGGADVVDLLRVFVAIEACVCVVYFVLINAFIARLWVRLHRRVAWQLVKEVRLFAASSAIAALFSRPEVVILSLLATPREVGLFSAGMRIAELGLLLPDVFMVNVFPVLSSAFRVAEDVFARWQRIAVRAMLAYSLPLAACLLVGADDIVRLLFGNGFETAATVLRLLALNIVFFSLGAVFWRSLVARDGQRENVVIQSTMAVVRIGLGIVLIIALSAVGAGIAGAATAGLNWWLLAPRPPVVRERPSTSWPRLAVPASYRDHRSDGLAPPRPRPRARRAGGRSDRVSARGSRDGRDQRRRPPPRAGCEDTPPPVSPPALRRPTSGRPEPAWDERRRPVATRSEVARARVGHGSRQARESHHQLPQRGPLLHGVDDLAGCLRAGCVTTSSRRAPPAPRLGQQAPDARSRFRSTWSARALPCRAWR